MQTLLKTYTGAQILLKTLQTLGTDTIFGYPGGIVLGVYDEYCYGVGYDVELGSLLNNTIYTLYKEMILFSEKENRQN